MSTLIHDYYEVIGDIYNEYVMGKKIHKSSGTQSDTIESGDTEQAWRALARIIARRHIRNQLNKIKEDNDENIINHDGNSKTSKG